MERPDMHDSLTDYYTMTSEVLGKGYFAVVKVGIEKKTGKKVAIKVIDKEVVERDETLRNEIDILSKVTHPNIVQMYAIFDTPENLFIVMELMEGGELYEEIIQRSTFTEAEAAKIIKQLLSALVYLHEQGVVHRDLKLENLLLAKKGELTVKLADFGLSKIFSASGGLYTACGTPFYVDETGYGPSVDMWAVGVILYILLSGRMPFSGDNDDELFRSIMEGDLVWKSPQFDTVSEDAKDLIRNLIVVDPEARFTAQEALDHRFIKDNTNTTPLHRSLGEGIRQLSMINKKSKEAKKHHK